MISPSGFAFDLCQHIEGTIDDGEGETCEDCEAWL